MDDRFKMYLKVKSFLKDHDSIFSTYPSVIALRNELQALIDEVINREVDAITNLSGYTEQKAAYRKTLVAATMKVSSALLAYLLIAGTDSELKPAAAEPPIEPRKHLAGRLIIFGAIPIAVFCAFFVLSRAFLGIERRCLVHKLRTCRLRDFS